MIADQPASVVPLDEPPCAAAAPLDGRGPRAALSVVAAVAVGGAVLLGALVLAGGRPEPSVAGLPDAGAVTGWTLPTVRLVFDLAAVATVGALLVAAVLLPSSLRRLSPVATTAVRSAAWSAGLWAVSSVLLLVLTASETAGVPLGGLTGQQLGDTAAVGRGRALVVVAALSAALALGCGRAWTPSGARWCLLAAGLAVLPTTLTGHAATAADHELAVSSLVVHVVAATVWVGGLLALLLFVRRPADLASAVPRFSVVALACFTLVALSGLLSAVERVGVSPASWASGYGSLLLLKTAALLVLGAMGWRHRRRLVPALAAGRPGAFLSFAGAELVVMAGAFALAVALSRTPTPVTTVAAAPVAAHGAGHETLPTTLDAVSSSGLLLEWRVNAIVLAVLGLAAVAYLAGVRRLSADGTSWPGRRSTAFAAGLGTALVALSGGVATYAAAMLSVQVAQFVLLLVLVPALLVLGRPLTLLRLIHGPGSADDGTAELPPGSTSRVLSALTDPLAGMALVAGLVFVVYRTELLDRALGSAGLLLLVNTAVLGVGCLLVWPALGDEAGARPRGAGDRVVPLLAAAVSLLLLAAELRYSDRLLAGRWFAELGWDWVDPATDQRLAATFAAAGAGLLMLLAATAWQVPAVPVTDPYPDRDRGEAAAGATTGHL